MNRLSVAQLDSLVRTRGLKMTPQRHAIVDFLSRAENHPTVEEVFDAVNAMFPMTSRATVYNTLTLLKESGLVHEIFEEGAVRIDPNLSPHHHFICRRCSKMEDVPWDAVQSIPVGQLPGNLSADSYEVTLRGLCADCQKKQ